MAYKIILDPGHGGSDPGANFNGRQEKDDALALAMAVGKLLTNAGFDVEYTRTADVYNTPFEKAMIANNAGGDLFVSFHRNSSAVPNTYTGVQTLVYNREGLKEKLAENINKNLTAIGFEDKGIVERPNLVVLKRTKMPAVLIEAGFINSDKDNELFDNNFNEIAQGIADAIIDTLDDSGISATDAQVYTIQVGAFRNGQLANNMAAQLKAMQFPAMVVFEDGVEYETADGEHHEARGYDSVVLSMGYRNYNPLEEQVKAIVPDTYVIGDAIRARRALDATKEAYDVASQI